jgi:hypothetical protein
MIEPTNDPEIDLPIGKPEPPTGPAPDDGGLGSDGIDQGTRGPRKLPLGVEMGNEPDEFEPGGELPAPLPA